MTASKTVLATLILFRSVRVTTLLFFFFFNDTATTEIYTLSLHDALPIWGCSCRAPSGCHDTRPPYPRSERTRRLCLSGSAPRQRRTADQNSRRHTEPRHSR